MAEIYCKTCNYHGELGRPARHEDVCPDCGNMVWRRIAAAPSPQTHTGALLRGLMSLRAVMFLGVVALAATVPFGAMMRIATVLLYIAAMKVVMRAARAQRDPKEAIEFPEVSPEELFDKGAIFPIAIYVILFVFIPPIFLYFGRTSAWELAPEEVGHTSVMDDAITRTVQGPDVNAGALNDAQQPSEADAMLADPDTDGAPAVDPNDPLAQALQQAGIPDGKVNKDAPDLAAATAPMAAAAEQEDPPASSGMRMAFLCIGLLLVLWAPMALVLYMRQPSVFSYFNVPFGFTLMRHDPSGYVFMAVLVSIAFGARYFIDVLAGYLPIYVVPVLMYLRALVILVAFGVCGLYVRAHARVMDLPIDDEDWGPLPPPAPARAAQARPPSRPTPGMAMPGAAMARPDDDVPDAPVVTGQLLE